MLAQNARMGHPPQNPSISVMTTVTLRVSPQSNQNVWVTLNLKNELVVWILFALGAGIAFFTSHTFYVTRGTYASGAVLLGVTAFLFYLRFRPRQAPRTKILTATSNTVLSLLTLVVVLYVLGVATWYE